MMRRASIDGPIDRRLSETIPSDPSEVLLVAVVKAHKRGPAPALAPGVMARIRRTLGEHPARPGLLHALRPSRALPAAGALASVAAVAFAGVQLMKARGARVHPVPAGPGLVSSLAPPPVAPPGLGTLAPQAASVLPDLRDAPAITAPAKTHRRPRATGPATRTAAMRPQPSAPVPAVAPPGARSNASAERVPEAPDSFEAQARQLKHGLELRRAGDLAGAAVALEQYRAAYPKGAFWAEATLAELDAQLALGRRADALALLQQVGDGPDLPRAAELRLLRSELLAREGRCDEAMSGFQAALGIPSLAERALYGRASCEGALGHPAGSRSDFEDYLARYPQGAFAAEARRALEVSR